MTTQQEMIYETVKKTGVFFISACSTTKEKTAAMGLYKKGVLKVEEHTATIIKFVKNWK